MNKPKHTPGPWLVNTNLNEDPILTDDGISPLDFEAVGLEYAANLRLIAAAPKLLELLKIAQNYVIIAGDPRSVELHEAIVSAITKAVDGGK